MGSTVWTGDLTVGGVAIPVKLSCAAKREGVTLNMLHAADGSRIKQVLYCEAEDKAISRSETVKGFEHEPGKYAVVTEAMLAEIKLPSQKSIDLAGFIKVAEIDPLLYDAAYFVRPADAAAEPAYAALFLALGNSKRAGVAKITMWQRESTAIVRAGKCGLVLHTLYYQDEVRWVDEFRTVFVPGNPTRRLPRAPFDWADVDVDGYRAALMEQIEKEIGNAV